MKFCGECGFRFGTSGNGAGEGTQGDLSIGDKNVIAGDVIGKKKERS